MTAHPDIRYVKSVDVSIAYAVLEGTGPDFVFVAAELKGVPGEWRLYAVAG